ncbi:MAG: cytochrome c oxidase subunit II [Pseudomonadota bacterium]|nr:cytochrome c oxidase subunit II [Pseudomonadota bacterium]
MIQLMFVIGRCLLFAFFAGQSSTAMANYTLNMPVGVTKMSHEIYNLHMFIFFICMAVVLVVFVLLFYAVYYHRKRKGAKAKQFHGSLVIELIWTAVPLALVILMLIPTVRVLYRINDVSEAVINIKVTGIQWKWRYEYLEDGIVFFSNLSTPLEQIQGLAPKGKYYLYEVDKPLVVPVQKKVKLLFTSNDVNHSWWVPELGIKRDCIPGYINEAWIYIEKPGTYRGQCTELCGMQHGFMPVVVEAKTEKDYNDWLTLQKGGQLEVVKTLPRETLLSQGKQVYTNNCQACHQVSGQGLPPAIKALAGSKKVTGPADCPISILLNGIQGSAMQSFAEQLSDADIASVLSYIRTSWGNDNKESYGEDAGELIQPEMVTKARKDWQENGTVHTCTKME